MTAAVTALNLKREERLTAELDSSFGGAGVPLGESNLHTASRHFTERVPGNRPSPRR